MKLKSLVVLICIGLQANAQDLELYTEVVDGGYNLYANNKEACPVSIELDFTLRNVKLTEENGKVYLLKAKSSKQLVTRLLPEPNTTNEFKYRVRVAYGDALQSDYDSDYPYSLPFATGSSYRIDQGYNGQFSHQNESALDFKMPTGTPVHAIRDGIVIDVVDEYDGNCLDKSCEAYNNVVIIYHDDGTFADYAHIRKKGAVIKKGDIVKQDQLIAYSGNVGWSSAPHLHLSVFLFRFKRNESIQTRFKINDGTEHVFLKEGDTYTKKY